jgi:hypothetical protein
VRRKSLSLPPIYRPLSNDCRRSCRGTSCRAPTTNAQTSSFMSGHTSDLGWAPIAREKGRVSASRAAPSAFRPFPSSAICQSSPFHWASLWTSLSPIIFRFNPIYLCWNLGGHGRTMPEAVSEASRRRTRHDGRNLFANARPACCGNHLGTASRLVGGRGGCGVPLPPPLVEPDGKAPISGFAPVSTTVPFEFL